MASDSSAVLPLSLVQSWPFIVPAVALPLCGRLRDALVGVSQQTRSTLVESLQFNELKSSDGKIPGPPSFGGSEEIVVRIADCVLFARRQGFRMHNLFVSITKASVQSASCSYPGMVERN
jgi:hypothetical protein